MPALGRLRDRVDPLAVAFDGHEVRRRGEIAIPQIVVDGLEMPESLARPRIEREQRVRIEVVARTISAPEIRRRRTGRQIDDPALAIESHPGPGVCAAALAPGALGPRLRAELVLVRNGVEAPAKRPCMEIERADVPRRGSVDLADLRAEDDQVLEDHAGRR